MGVETVVDWRALIQAEAANAPEGRGFAHVGDMLGVTRCYVSRAMSKGKSGLGDNTPPAFIQRVIDVLYIVRECPATGAPTHRSECERLGNGPAPTHKPLEMQIWRTCQGCPFKPSKKEVT